MTLFAPEISMCAQVYAHNYFASTVHSCVCVCIYWGILLLLEYHGIVVATKLPTPMADKSQLLAHLSGFTPLLFSGVLLQHCTYSLFTNTPSHLHDCQTLLVVGKDIQWPHQDMHTHSLSLIWLTLQAIEAINITNRVMLQHRVNTHYYAYTSTGFKSITM